MKMKHAVLVTLATAVLLVLAACGATDPAPGATDPASGDLLDGTSWELMAYRKTSPIRGTTLTATFEGGEVRGSAGCNTYGATYRLQGSAIEVSDLTITEMACLEPEGVMEQETLFMGFLSDAHDFRFVDDQLQIFCPDHEALTFIPRE